MSADELAGVKSTILLDNRQSMLYSEQGNEYLIKKSCQVVSPQIFQSQTCTNGQVSFQVQLPSKSVMMDVKAFVEMKALIKFTGIPNAPVGVTRVNDNFVLPVKPAIPDNTNNATSSAGFYLSTFAFGAMRSTPLSACTENLSVYINGVSISNTLNDYSQLFSLGLYTQDMNRLNYSGAFSYGDKTQQYDKDSGEDPLQSSINPFSTYINTDGSSAYRGDFDYRILSNPVGNGVDEVEAYLGVTWYEPIMSAPFQSSGQRGDTRSIAGVNQLQLNWSLSNINRMWSGVVTTNVNTVDVLLSGSAFNFATGSNLHLTFISPSPILGPLPNVLRYDCELFNNYKQLTGVLTSGAAARKITSNNIQLNVIPSKCLIFCNKVWGNFLGNNAWKNTDALARIERISIQFNNIAGIMSAASEWQLYSMSIRNGLEMSWRDWQKHRGSILVLDFSKDMPSDSLSAVGVSGQYNFNCEVTVSNPNDAGFGYDYDYYLNILFIQDALLEITPANTRLSNGFDRSVILRDINEGNVDLSTIDFAYAPNMIGSAWWNNISDFKSALVKGLKTVHKYLPQIDSAYEKYAAPILPGGVNVGFHALTKVAQELIPMLVGQGMSGGKIHKMFEGKIPSAEIDRLIMSASNSRLRKKRY